MSRITNHPVLGPEPESSWVWIWVDGQKIRARLGEPVAAAIVGSGRMVLRYSPRFGEARGVFCGVGRCNECLMEVDGISNVRTCVTPVRPGMVVNTQGLDKRHE